MKGQTVQFPESSSRINEEKDRLSESIVDDTKIHLLEYWRLLKRNKWVIVAIMICGAAIGFYKATSEVSIYQAKATMLIEPRSNQVTSTSQVFYSYANTYLFYQTQYEIIGSRSVAERVAAKLGPDRRPVIQGETSPRQVVGELGSNLFQTVGSLFGVSGTDQPDRAANPVNDIGNPASSEASKQQLAGIVRQGLQVKGGEKSQIVHISYDSPDPQFAADVTNATTEAYIELSLDARLSAAKVAGVWLTEQVEGLRQRVVESEARLQAFQSSEKLVDTERLRDLSSTRLETLNSDYIRTQSKVSELAKRYGKKHPTLVAARAELAELKGRLQAEKNLVVSSQKKSFALAKLERDVATNRQLYDQFLTKNKESDIASQYDINNVRVIDSATVPGSPYKPNRQRIIFVYLIGGLAIGVLLAWLREHIDNTYKIPEDVESLLNTPVLGVVPLLEKQRKKSDAIPERYYIADPRSSFSESINHIRTSILFSNFDNPPQIVLSTSGIQSEGKTTLSTNLSLAFSQLGPTLLLDADLRKPRVADIAGVHRHGGLTDVVAGQCNVQDVIIRDPDAANLFIMKSGTHPPNPLELLSSQKFKLLIEELRKSFEHIIVDTSPVLPVSDAIVLGNLVDGVVLVIKAGSTAKSVSRTAYNRLLSAKADVLGVAFSQVSQRRMNYYYEDSYYGYYGQYYGHDKRRRKSGKKTAVANS